jgi:hypothetical protein
MKVGDAKPRILPVRYGETAGLPKRIPQVCLPYRTRYHEEGAKMKILNSILLFVSLVAYSVPSRACTLNMGLSLKYQNTPIVSITYYGKTYSNVYAGALSATLTPRNALPNGYPSSFDTYCVDLNDEITVPTNYCVSMQPINGLANGGGVAWLYDHFGTNLYGTQVSDATSAAGLQIAIWKVLTDNSTDLSSGNFKYDGSDDIATDANDYLTQWKNSGYQTADATWLEHDSNNGQNMIGPPVPEPSVFSLMGACIIGLTTFGWSLKKKRTAL